MLFSLDAGSRMDGIAALDLWDFAIEVLHSSSNHARARRDQSRHKYCDKRSNERTKEQSLKLEDFGSTEVGYATANAKLSRHHALLYICQDNEAVMKMIIKGRSPTMRHVSRTDSVALDWLFDRIKS